MPAMHSTRSADLFLKAVLCCCLPALLGCYGSSLLGPGEVDGPLRFDGQPELLETVPVEAYAPHLSEDGQAWEAWEYIFQFSTGHTLISRFQVTNAGPGSNRAVSVGVIIAPDGRTALIRNSRERKDWTYSTSPSGVELRLARHLLRMSPPRFHVHMEHSQGRFTIDAESLTPAFRPGRLMLSKDKSYTLTVLAPRLKARGVVQLPGGPEVDLGEGHGIAVHAYSDMADHKQALSQLRFHTFDQGTQMSLLEFTTPERYEYQRVALMLVTRGNEIVHHSCDYGRTFTSLELDPEKPNYPKPLGFRLTERSPAGSVSGDVTLRTIRRFDILSWLNSAVARFFVKQVSHPIQYLFRAPYDVQVELGGKSERLIGTGFSTLSILNKPPQTAW
jgi:hypothetical protein